MNPASPLQLGDEVEIIGPDSYGDISRTGKKFKISELRLGNNEEFDGVIMASRIGVPWYPASSLRKVEELQIGDKVEVIGPTYLGYEGMKGLKSHIWRKTDTGNFEIFGSGFFPASSLRKLAPDEIPHGQTIGEAMQEFSDDVEKAKAAIRDILAPLVDDRLKIIEQNMESFHDFQMEQNREVGRGLSAIERQIAAYNGDGRSQAKFNCDIKERLLATEQRLAFVEAFQKGHVEETPCIDDVVSKILDDPALQKGDYVEVQRDGCGKKKGFVFCITWIKTEENSIIGPRTYYSANKLPMWTADELRKLSDEEISKRLNGEEMER